MPQAPTWEESEPIPSWDESKPIEASKPLVAIPGTTFTTPPASLDETEPLVGADVPLINPQAIRTAIQIGSAGMGNAPVVEGFREGAAQQLAGFTTPKSIAITPAFSIPFVGPGLALGLGAKAVGSGAGTLTGALESGNMREAGQGLSEVAGGGAMLLAGGHQGYKAMRPTVTRPPFIRDIPQQLEKPIEPAATTTPAEEPIVIGTQVEAVMPDGKPVAGTVIGSDKEGNALLLDEQGETHTLPEKGGTSHADQIEGAVESVRNPPPGPAAQVAEGTPGEVQPTPGARPGTETGLSSRETPPERKIKRLNRPFVSSPITQGPDSITVTYRGGQQETLKGQSVLLPNFEEYPVVLTKPSGSKAKGTKRGWTVWDKETGEPIAESSDIAGKPSTQQEALLLTLQRLRAYGKERWDERRTKLMRDQGYEPTGEMPAHRFIRKSEPASEPAPGTRQAGEAGLPEAEVETVDLGNGVRAEIAIGKNSAEATYYDSENATVGHLNVEQLPDGKMAVESHSLRPEVRGSGHGQAVVKRLGDRFGEIWSDEHPSELASAMWERLGAKKEPILVGEDRQYRYVYRAKSAPNLSQGALGESGMGGAKPGETGQPTIGESIPAREIGSAPGTFPAVEPGSSAGIISRIRGLFSKENLGGMANYVKGALGGMAGETLPRTTRLSREAGEMGARYISSKIAAPFAARIFARDVLAGLDIDPVKFGAALSEDNLRSIEGHTFTFIGENKPFKTEAEYQDFLKEPQVQEAIKRHIDNWNAVIEPQYREAMQIDPAEVLASRGEQTGARVNLAAILEGEALPPGAVTSSGKGNLLNTMRKKSPFGRKAKGTGEAYAANYSDIIANTFYKQLEIANKNAFDEALVKHGLAIIDDPGQHPVLGGEETTGFPLKRKTIIIPDQGAFSQNKTIYVRKSIAREYRNAANVDENPFGNNAAVKVVNLLNQSALAGLTDATVHLTNLSTGLMQVPAPNLYLLADSFASAAGRLDLAAKGLAVARKGAPELLRNSKILRAVTPDVVLRSVEDAFWKNQTQLADLAQIGALKSQHPSSGLPGLRQMSQVIQWYDRTARLVLDDVYRNLAEQGLVENTETARREFVNQIGQYNRRAQGALVRLSRDLGTGPFATAGRAFNVLGVRGVTLNPGVKASTPTNAVLLRANAAAKWIGTLSFVALANYLLTGKMGGRPGTPIGSIDTGKNDEQGRMKSFSVINLTGQGRALRVTGLRGAIEAKQKGLPNATAADSAMRDIVNSWISPFAGPAVKTAFIAASGYAPAINVGRASPVVPPGESQAAQNIKTTLLEANPVIAGIEHSTEPGKDWRELVRTQMPRFTMQVKQPERMIANYPAIVRRAQANAFVEDVIHRARYIEKDEDRVKYIREALTHLAPEDREHAKLVLRFRKIKF